MGKMNKDILYRGVIVVLVALIIIVCVIGLSGGKKTQTVPEPVTLKEEPDGKKVITETKNFITEETIIETDLIQSGLNDMGVLITEEYYFTEAVKFSSVKKLFKTDIELKFTESNYLATYDGVITAGIDFEKIEVVKDDTQKKIVVTVPKASIQNIDLDPNSFTLYSEKTGIGNPLSADDFNSSLKELEETAEKKALERGLLERADENAENVIGNFIKSFADLQDYSLSFAKK